MHRELTCIIIDDELLALSYLRTLCEEIPGVSILKAYDNPQKLLADLPELKVDFCISDIVMPGMNGLELAEKLGKVPVIFTTAHNEFAADAYDIHAIDYLRKPLKKERLEMAIDKVEVYLATKALEPVSLTTSKGKMRIAPETIACIIAETIDRRDKLLLLKNGTELVIKNCSFDQITELLPPHLFIRVSRKEIISKDIVKGHSSELIFTKLTNKDGTERTFLLGKNYRKAFLEQLGR